MTHTPQETFQISLRQASQKIHDRVGEYKKLAKTFYFEVLYSNYKCPKCEGKLVYSASSQAKCLCGAVIDPTIKFQKSSCCNDSLVKKVFHYACRRCGKPVRSIFLFEERVFDKEYFKSMMRQSRERKRKKREELKQLLAGTHSDSLVLESEYPSDSIAKLDRVLNEFVGSVTDFEPMLITEDDPFVMEEYRKAMWEIVESSNVLFSAFRPLHHDLRKDRSRRFITLIYMEHDHEVDLLQQGDDILVMRHETYAEG